MVCQMWLKRFFLTSVYMMYVTWEFRNKLYRDIGTPKRLFRYISDTTEDENSLAEAVWSILAHKTHCFRKIKTFLMLYHKPDRNW